MSQAADVDNHCHREHGDSPPPWAGKLSAADSARSTCRRSDRGRGDAAVWERVRPSSACTLDELIA